MNEREIYSSYKSAKRPKSQIKILAQLNGCKPKDIEEIIIRQQYSRMQKELDHDKNMVKNPKSNECGSSRNDAECGSRYEAIFKRLDELDVLIYSYTEEYKRLVRILKNDC